MSTKHSKPIDGHHDGHDWQSQSWRALCGHEDSEPNLCLLTMPTTMPKPTTALVLLLVLLLALLLLAPVLLALLLLALVLLVLLLLALLLRAPPLPAGPPTTTCSGRCGGLWPGAQCAGGRSGWSSARQAWAARSACALFW